MRILSTLPAFGFETANCNARNFNQAKFDKALSDYDEKTKDLDPAIADRIRQTMVNTQKNAYKFRNVSRVIAYIPGIATLLGIGHLITACMTPKTELTNKNKHIARAIAEIFSVSFLLVGVDVVVTLKRKEKKTKSEQV